MGRAWVREWKPGPSSPQRHCQTHRGESCRHLYPYSILGPRGPPVPPLSWNAHVLMVGQSSDSSFPTSKLPSPTSLSFALVAAQCSSLLSSSPSSPRHIPILIPWKNKFLDWRFPFVWSHISDQDRYFPGDEKRLNSSMFSRQYTFIHFEWTSYPWVWPVASKFG